LHLYSIVYEYYKKRTKVIGFYGKFKVKNVGFAFVSFESHGLVPLFLTFQARTEADNSELAVNALRKEVEAKQFEVEVNKEQLVSAHDMVKWMEAAIRGKYAFVVKSGAAEKRAEVFDEQAGQRDSLAKVLDVVGTKHDEDTVTDLKAVFAAD
jgi:hypothetical protein